MRVTLQTAPKGKLVSPVALNPDGELRPLNVNADGELLVTGGAGAVTTVVARAYLNALQDDIVDDTLTKVLLDTENFNVGLTFADNKFTIITPGYYLILASVAYKGGTVVSDKRHSSVIYLNGGGITWGTLHSSNTDNLYTNCQTIVHCDADDYIEIYCRHRAGVDTVDLLNTERGTFVAVALLFED